MGEGAKDVSVGVWLRSSETMQSWHDRVPRMATKRQGLDTLRIVISSGEYTLEDDLLHYVEDDGTSRVIPPVDLREHLFTEAHGGKFGAHLSNASVQ
jgi:hypothetical protein